MKKIIASAVVVLTSYFFVATAAKAEQYWAAVYSEAYEGDTSPSTAQRANYTAYYCTEAVAQTMFGGATSVEGIESYLKSNFATGKSAMGSTAGSVELTGGDYGLGQYSFIKYATGPIETGTYLAVAFYGEEAFRVFGAADAVLDSGRLKFTDKNAPTGSVGAWQTVPEPTSGLLMLCGFALMALRRKRV